LLQQNFLVETIKNSFVVPNFVAVTKPFFSVYETKTGVGHILVIFQDRHLFNHIIQKVAARAFH